MGPANSWEVTRDTEGLLRWRSEAGELTRQPARSLWQRIENLVFRFFPANLY
jgi:hypothetical protein